VSLLRLYTRVLELLGKEARLGWILAVANLLLAAAQFAEPVLFGRYPAHAPAVNCTPWSVLNTSGFPPLKASSSISVQNDPSSVFESFQATTYRLNQSITAARYMNPVAIGT